MTVSPFDHPLLSAFLGDERVAELFTIEAEIAACEAFETALAIATAAHGLIPEGVEDTIAERLASFTPDLEVLAQATERDGLYLPGLVAQMRAHIGDRFGDRLHFGATSQDVLDTSLVLRLRDALAVIESELTEVVGKLYALDERFGHNRLMGVTRMQEAVQMTVGDRLTTWRAPIVRHLERIEEIKPRLLVVQFGGAVGTRDKLGEHADAVVQRLADELKLRVPEQSWHSQRDSLAEFAGWLSLITGALGKLGQDAVLMAQNGVDTIAFEGGGGSSAMPHKHNPVGGESLVALARFNATQLSAMHQALIHEQERSGAAWTLEWMVLPQMAVATAGAIRRTNTLLESITHIGQPE